MSITRRNFLLTTIWGAVLAGIGLPGERLHASQANIHKSSPIEIQENAMPLVNISILKGKSPEYIKAIADGINSAVIETMGFPDDDRYQIIHELEPHCLQFQNRTEDRVMMHLIMRAGRSNKSKQAFYAKVVENLAADPGVDPANVLITIAGNHDIDWSFRDGIAQFVV